MPNPKFSIGIKKSEKELYRIFKDLEKYGRCAFSYPDKKIQNSISRTIGARGRHLVTNKMLWPPTNFDDSRQIKKRTSIVALPIDVKIVEKKENGLHRFYFKKFPRI